MENVQITCLILISSNRKTKIKLIRSVFMPQVPFTELENYPTKQDNI